MKTKISVSGKRFLINGQPVYSELANPNPASVGLLWNQRVIQGVFDDKVDRTRFNLFKEGVFDPDQNTENLIASLPQWYAYGLRAITVGFQGGGPVGYVENRDIDNNPFGADGAALEAAYAERMDRIIRAADELGMVVIVSLLYGDQASRIRDGRSVVNAVKTGCGFLRERGYTNVIVEVANEYDVPAFASHPIVYYAEGAAELIRIARESSGGMLVGCSGSGGSMDREVAEESDVVIVHGNGQTRGEYYDFLLRVKRWAGDKPVLCNEDSPCCTRVDVGLETYTSWGYYNNYTKQIPPADYGVTPGEDLFFARQVARAVGIPVRELPLEEQFCLQGLEDWSAFGGKRAVRLAAEFPEKVDYVDFFLNGEKLYRSYDEPFFLDREQTWLCRPREARPGDLEWKASVRLCDGTVVTKQPQNE